MIINGPILITGFMGAGKTTLGGALAKRLNCIAVDLDELIHQHEGRTAKQIILEDGEVSFRDVETRYLRQTVTTGTLLVVSLGGGAWTLDRNRQLIAAAGGVTVWLDVPFDDCWKRIKDGGSERPLAPDEVRAASLWTRWHRVNEILNGMADSDGLAATVLAALEQHQATKSSD